MQLITPETIRNSQRALYQRAKQSPKQRFYSLYDKVYRSNVVAHAFARCRANGGAAGPDGVTFESMDDAAVQAVLSRVTEQLQANSTGRAQFGGCTFQRRTVGNDPWVFPTSSTESCKLR